MSTQRQRSLILRSDLPDAAGTDAVFNQYRAAVDWMNRSHAVGPAWQDHPSIALFNNSWGPVVENNDNGNNRFARFVDYFANTRDVLFVGAAGNDADTPPENDQLALGRVQRNHRWSARLKFPPAWTPARTAHASIGVSTGSTRIMERRPTFAESRISSLLA